MEWVLSGCDTINWSIKMSQADGFELLMNLKEYTTTKNLVIGPRTFASGFMLILHEACRSGHFQLVQYILNHHKSQFDINQLILYHPNFDYDISLKTIRWLCNHRKEALVHAAVHSQSVELLQLLVSHNASVNVPDCCSMTPLLKAITRCDYDTIRYLLSVGCNVNYQDTDGCTVLMYICRTHVLPDIIEKILQLLINAGADPTITDHRGYTVVHEAVYNKNSIVLKLLIKTLKISPVFGKTHQQPLFLANQLLDLYSTKPTCSFPTHIIIDHPQCTSQLKINQVILNATYSLYRYCCDYNLHPEQDLRDCIGQFEHAVRLRIKLGMSSESLCLASKVYDHISVNSLEEFLKKYSDNTTGNLIEIAYLCLIMREHILGYGDSTLIEFLFMFGKAFSETTLKNHIEQGLKLWLRATEMLFYRFKENVYGNLKELQKLTESGLEKCSNFVKSNKLSHNHAINLHQSTLLPILQNLVKCEYMADQQFKARHYHDIISPAGYRYLVRTLQDLYVLKAPVSPLIYDTVLKCSTFCYGFKLSTNVLDVLLDESDVSLSFLSLLLKYGGYKVINDIGLFGIRILYKAKTKDVVDLLIEYGAHTDAVNEDGLYGNPHFRNKYFSSPLPLKCLVARAIVFHGIKYRSCDITFDIKEFISMHDPDLTQFKIKEGLQTLY